MLTEPVTMFAASYTYPPPVVFTPGPAVDPESVLPGAPTLGQIKRLQDVIADLPQIENRPQHYFAPGMYVRALPIKAGSVVVGKMHRHEHVVMLMQGETTISTAEGMRRFSAPHIWTSRPGEKRVLVTHTDCVFATCHANPDDERDLDVIEAAIIIPESLIDYDSQVHGFADALQRMYA